MRLEARGLECVRGDRRLFRNLSFSLGAGECLELRGPNGSGKTSLLSMLCGLLSPASGVILWDGEPIVACRATYLAGLTHIGHRSAVKDELTALENLRLASALSGHELSLPEARAGLRRLSLGDQEHRQARDLSEGQRRRLALARLISCRSSLWLLDEVLASLDAAAAGSVLSLIRGHLSRGGLAVIATHQPLALGGSRRIELAA